MAVPSPLARPLPAVTLSALGIGGVAFVGLCATAPQPSVATPPVLLPLTSLARDLGAPHLPDVVASVIMYASIGLCCLDLAMMLWASATGEKSTGGLDPHDRYIRGRAVSVDRSRVRLASGKVLQPAPGPVSLGESPRARSGNLHLIPNGRRLSAGKLPPAHAAGRFVAAIQAGSAPGRAVGTPGTRDFLSHPAFLAGLARPLEVNLAGPHGP
jgi:hypothetical protein